MAGTEGWSRILHRKDERGVIVETRVFGPDDEIPEGFEAADYEPIYAPREDDQEPVAESELTTWENPVAVRGTWVENRPEDAEVSEGTPVQARDEDELTDAEREALEQVSVEESDEDDESEELSEGTPREAREQAEDGELTEAEKETDEVSSPEPPPQGGPGSGKTVWEQYAAANGVEVPEDATRDDIIAACEAAGVRVD